MNLNNLGNGLSDRYARTRRLEDLEEAIKSYQRAVTGTPPDSPDLPMNLNNLGNGLRARYARTGRLEDLEEAIKSYQRAVTGTPPDSPDLPSRLNNLGNGLRARYARTGRLEDLEEAIKSYRAACDLGAAAAPQEVLNAARNWGRWAVQRQQWSETAEAYGYGLTTGRQMLARQLQRSQKENTLADLQEMAAPAAYALTKLGKLEQAVAIAEGGRARLLGEAMERNRRDLEQLPSLGHAELHRRYLELVATQERLMQPVAAQPGQPDHLSGSARIDAIIAANTAFDQVVTEIQQIPGYADFLAEPGFARIQAAAQPGSPLVYLLATSAGGLALVVGGEEEHKPGFLEKPGLSPVTAIWLDDLSEAKLREVVYGPADDPALGGYLGAYDRWRRNSRSADARAAWHAALDATTVWLWNSVMAPVVDHLAQAGVTQAVLIPSGLLGLLPLHAAWTDSLSHNVGAEPGTPTDSLSHNVGEGRGEGLRRYALDTVTFSYAPSGLALSASQQQAQAVHTDGLLAVDNPDGSLLFSGQEVDAALSHFALAQSQRLVGFAATLDTVKQAISGQPVLHFSTHGWAGWGNPLQGGLLLAGDAHLTLEEMLALRLPAARLAVLSACETGIPGTKLPDEVIGLPAGLLQAGVAGVVASLWAVNDLSTARLMERFYQHWRAEGLAPAQALCQAQRWLRDVTRAELGDYYASFIARLPPAEAQAARAALIFTGDPNDRPYSHPYYWAGFTYSGA
jgi:CHAT domain-containing protein